MSVKRWVPWAALAVGLSVALMRCGATSACEAMCASGCCDAQGVCLGGTSELACGQAGQACALCPFGSSCMAQACVAGGPGGGSGAAGAPGGSAGGAAGGSAGGAGGSAPGGSGGSGGVGGGGGTGGGQACFTVGTSCTAASQCCGSNSDCKVTTVSPSHPICCGKAGSTCGLGDCCAPLICRTITGSIRVCQ